MAAIEVNHYNNFDITFKELADHYLSYIESKRKESSYTSKKSVIDLYIIIFFGKIKTNKITSKHIIAWQKEMLLKYFSHEYLSIIYCNLSAIFNFGVKNHNIKENPCKKVGNFKKPEDI